LVLGFGQGMSLRGIAVWLKCIGFPSASASNPGKVIECAVFALKLRNKEPEMVKAILGRKELIFNFFQFPETPCFSTTTEFQQDCLTVPDKGCAT